MNSKYNFNPNLKKNFKWLNLNEHFEFDLIKVKRFAIETALGLAMFSCEPSPKLGLFMKRDTWALCLFFLILVHEKR